MSNNRSLFTRSSGVLFEPKFTRGKKKSTAYLQKQKNINTDLDDLKNTNLNSTSSYRYGDKKYLVSTQQVKTDYSRFENHTFFHSAVANVNEAFDRIVNFYPFEGSRKKLEMYEDGLTGFEKYVLDKFPKNTGYLNFSGTQPGENINNGTFIEVLDSAGTSIQSISDRKDGRKILDPLTSSFSLEFWIKPSGFANDNQIIFQKYRTLANNMTLVLSKSSSTNSCGIQFALTSGSNYALVTGSIPKGTFSHVTAMYDRTGDQRAKLLVNDQIFSSSQQVVFDSLDYNGSSLFIGKGVDARLGESVFSVKESFTGSMDDIRFFHKVNEVSKIRKNKHKSFFPPDKSMDDTLKLYYKFNSPSGNYVGNDIALDSSGNSLHSRITNHIQGFTRTTGSDNPMVSEQLHRNPVLFPTHPDVSALNVDLLSSASNYDDYNPNIITKLVPNHYFDQGTNFRNFNEELDNIAQNFENISDSNIGKNKNEVPSPQVLMKLLFTYAKFFDELKIYIDAITSFRHTSYDDYDTTPDALLEEKAKLTNTHLPQLFRYANIDQFFNGIDFTNEKSRSAISLEKIQKEIWRRYISEAPRINLKKGTLDAVRSVFRNAGIEPDNIFNLREFGGSKEKSLDSSRELKRDVFNFLSFTGSLGKITTENDYQGYPLNAEIPRIKSNFLSASRIQIGNPQIAGSFVNKNSKNIHGISNNKSDGLLTSGSFTYEGLYVWNHGYKNVPESLIRMHVTGTSAPSTKEGIIINLVGDDESVNLYVRDSVTEDMTHNLFLTGVNIFDKDIWYVSFGKKDTHDLQMSQTGSYFIRVAKQVNGEIIEQHATSSLKINKADSVLKNLSAYNTSGSFLVVGSQSFGETTTHFLNDSAGANASPVNSGYTSFSGLMANARFFSKALTDTEWKSHAKNYRSFGVDDPSKNYNFTNNTTGSFERLILQTDAKQSTTASNSSGNFRLFDFTQNNFHFEGSNFKASSLVTKPQRVNYEVLSDKFDINFSREKVRVRSFQNSENLETNYFSSIAPVSRILPSEESLDDNRFSIDMSVMKALNEHILLIFSDFSHLEDVFGAPNNLFSEQYHDASALRQIYFNNLLEKLDLQRYRDLFKWVDNTFTQAVFKVLPRSTNFLGINFIYESHILERNRMRYLSDEIYMKSQQRDPARGDIFLSQFVTKLRKF